MVFEQYVFAARGIDWIFGLSYASLVVFPNDGGTSLGFAEFFKKLAKVED